MIRTLAAAAALATLALTGAASAQTWGQPVPLNPYGRPVGGTALSEVETRSYVATGRWADGYSEWSQTYVPASGYRQGGGYGRYGRGHDRAYGYPRYGPSSRTGYRDEWGYNDDRPPSTRRWADDQRTGGHDHDHGREEPYFYDR